MHKAQDKPAQAAAALKFFDWAYKNGDKTADDLDYVPMPDAVKAHGRKAWARDQGRLRQGRRLQAESQRLRVRTAASAPPHLDATGAARVLYTARRRRLRPRRLPSARDAARAPPPARAARAGAAGRPPVRLARARRRAARRWRCWSASSSRCSSAPGRRSRSTAWASSDQQRLGPGARTSTAAW